MNPRVIIVTFLAAVAAVVAGFFGGGIARELVRAEPEVAIGVVDAEAGVAVATSSPPPTATLPPVETAEPAESVFEESPTPVPTPSAEASLEPCPGTPPREGCECRERRRNSRWVCPLN